MENMDLKDRLTELESQRTLLTANKDVIKSLREDFEERHKLLIEKIKDDALAVSETETEIRKIALEDFAKNGSKEVGFGVGIRVVKKYDYDKMTAFSWAKEHDMALKLDEPAFRKIAQVQDIDFVKVSEVPSATIPVDITKELAKAGGSVKENE